MEKKRFKMVCSPNSPTPHPPISNWLENNYQQLFTAKDNVTLILAGCMYLQTKYFLHFKWDEMTHFIRFTPFALIKDKYVYKIVLQVLHSMS